MRKKTMLVKNKKQKRKSLVRSFARAHGIFTLLIFMFYVVFAMLGDFSLLAQDIKSKYAWASTTISVYVESLPNQPVVSVSSGCVGEQAVANITWDATAATDYYDILRDGQLLVGGISGTTYVDDIVAIETSYTYMVIAHGSLGSITSLPATVLIGKCSAIPSPLPDPQCQIIALDGNPIDASLLVKTENNLPKISGTTNMANAIMLINVFPGPIVSSTMTAQSNGFWEYGIFSSLPAGVYAFQVTATDPHDSSRSITKSVQIEIIAKEDDNPNDGCGGDARITLCHKPDTVDQETRVVDHSAVGGHLEHGDYCGACRASQDSGVAVVPSAPVSDGDAIDAGTDADIPVDILSNPEKDLPLMMTAAIVNKNKIIYSRQNIFMQVFFNWNGRALQKTDLVYEIINAKGQLMSSIMRSHGASDETLAQIIPMPQNSPYGEYIMRLRMKVDGVHVTAQDSFEYREAPLVNLGGMMTFTYSELVSGVGWFAAICLLLMLILLVITTHEYYLYSGSLRTIAAGELKRDGLISRRKEVSP